MEAYFKATKLLVNLYTDSSLNMYVEYMHSKYLYTLCTDGGLGDSMQVRRFVHCVPILE